MKTFKQPCRIISTPVAFLGFKCLSEDLICPIDGVRGALSFNIEATSSISGTSVGSMSCQGLEKALCNLSAISAANSGADIVPLGSSLLLVCK